MSVEHMCPVDFWPEQSPIWREGFIEGWYWARKAIPATPIPVSFQDREYDTGFRMGITQFYLTGAT